MTETLGHLVVTAALLIVGGVVVGGPLLLIASAFALTHHRFGAPPAFVLAILLVGGFTLTPLPRIGIGALYFAVPPLRPSIVLADLALSRTARAEAIRLATSGSLPDSDRYGGYELPVDAKGLSVHGTVDLLRSECGQGAFFMTLTGFSPDPYAGFEYMPSGCEPETDPLGSGAGTAQPLGDGWFWIEAS